MFIFCLISSVSVSPPQTPHRNTSQNTDNTLKQHSHTPLPQNSYNQLIQPAKTTQQTHHRQTTDTQHSNNTIAHHTHTSLTHRSRFTHTTLTQNTYNPHPKLIKPKNLYPYRSHKLRLTFSVCITAMSAVYRSSCLSVQVPRTHSTVI